MNEENNTSIDVEGEYEAAQNQTKIFNIEYIQKIFTEIDKRMQIIFDNHSGSILQTKINKLQIIYQYFEGLKDELNNNNNNSNNQKPYMYNQQISSKNANNANNSIETAINLIGSNDENNEQRQKPKQDDAIYHMKTENKPIKQHFAVHCHFCKQHFVIYDEYVKHLQQHYDDNATKTWKKCDFGFCKKVFKNVFQFIGHISIHTADKPFKCDYPKCGKSYGNTHALTAHWKDKHVSKQKKFKSSTNDHEPTKTKIKNHNIKMSYNNHNNKIKNHNIKNHNRKRNYTMTNEQQNDEFEPKPKRQKIDGSKFANMNRNNNNTKQDVGSLQIRIQETDDEHEQHINEPPQTPKMNSKSNRNNNKNIWNGWLKESSQHEPFNLSLFCIGARGKDPQLNKVIPMKDLKINGWAKFEVISNGLRDLYMFSGSKYTIVLEGKCENDEYKEKYNEIIKQWKENKKVAVIIDAKMKMYLLPPFNNRDNNVFDVATLEELWECSLPKMLS